MSTITGYLFQSFKLVKHAADICIVCFGNIGQILSQLHSCKSWVTLLKLMKLFCIYDGVTEIKISPRSRQTDMYMNIKPNIGNSSPNPY